MKVKISTLLALVCLLPMLVLAQNPLTFTTNNGAITITGYVGSNLNVTNVVIPANINGYPVTSIQYSAFNQCTRLTSVVIPDSVTSIQVEAFYGCSVLANVLIGNSVTVIGDRAFYQCASLTSVVIPHSVTNIRPRAFSSCTSLTNITVDPTNTAYSSTNGVLFDKTQTTLIVFPAGVRGEYVVPAGVKSLGDYAFQQCSNLSSVIITNGVTNIGNSAFYDCSGMTNVVIGNSVTSIGHSAFFRCASLRNVVIPNSLTSIRYSMFVSCSGLTSVVIPDSVTNIELQVFYGCDGLTNVVIGNSVTSIGWQAFYQCTSLTRVVIPDSVMSIGDSAFRGCSGLTSLVIGNCVTNIGYGAFFDCSGLTNMAIPNTVTSIGDYALYGCSSLTSIKFLGNAPALFGPDVFTGVAVGAKVYYYFGATGWSTSYGGLSTVALYSPPQIVGVDNIFGVQSGNFRFTICGVSNQIIVVEASTNLVYWQPVWTNKLSGVSTNFIDAEWINFPARFYRAR